MASEVMRWIYPQYKSSAVFISLRSGKHHYLFSLSDHYISDNCISGVRHKAFSSYLPLNLDVYFTGISVKIAYSLGHEHWLTFGRGRMLVVCAAGAPFWHTDPLCWDRKRWHTQNGNDSIWWGKQEERTFDFKTFNSHAGSEMQLECTIRQLDTGRFCNTMTYLCKWHLTYFPTSFSLHLDLNGRLDNSYFTDTAYDPYKDVFSDARSL